MIELGTLLVCTLGVGYYMGFHTRDAVNAVRDLRSLYDSSKKTKSDTNEPKSIIVESLTPDQQAQKDFEERVKALNGGKL